MLLGDMLQQLSHLPFHIYRSRRSEGYAGPVGQGGLDRPDGGDQVLILEAVKKYNSMFHDPW